MKPKVITSIALLLACCYSGYGQAIVKGTPAAGQASTQITESGTNIDVGPVGGAVGGRLGVWSLPNFARAPQFNMSSNSTALIGANTSLSLFNRDLTANNWSRMHFATVLSNGSERDMVSLACHYRNRTAGRESGDFVIATTDSTIYAERVRLNSNGNFGIGNFGLTAVPERLNVLGNVSIGDDNGIVGGSTPPGGNANYLSFCGGTAFANGTKNSDAMWMYRVNLAQNSSELRTEIGDDYGRQQFGPDLFTIGGGDFRSGTPSFATLFAANITSGAVGIGTRTPGNRLEINSDVALGQTASGLRLTNLTSATPTVGNPGPGVLAVNASGDVIYVPDGGGSSNTASEGITRIGTDFQLGQACGTAPTSRFTVNREIHMGNGQLTNYNLYFNAGPSGNGGKLYMGSSSCAALQARLEIGSTGLIPTPTNSYSTTNPSLSGLRFSNLTMNTAFITNATNGVLSLDANGDVIWVEDKTGAAANNGCSINGANVQLGESCDAPTGLAALANNRLVPLNNNNMIFGDGNLSGAGKNRVGIGTNCMPNAKLEVVRNKETSIYDVQNRAIAGVNKDLALSPSGEAVGVYGSSDYIENANSLGGDFLGANARNTSYGVRGIAQGNAGNQAFGGWFSACGANSINVGVFGDVCQGGGNPGVDWAGYFTGNIITTAPFIFSDRRVKEDVQPIEHALNIISKINPKKYKFNTSAFPGLSLPTDKDNYGVIAQELEEVLPSLVKETPVPTADKKSFTKEMIKSVNYVALIPILIQAVKEQQIEIDQLKQQNELVKTLQQQIDELKLLVAGSNASSQNEAIAQLNVTLTNKTAIILGQNVPNPCDKSTTIGFYIPASVQTATIQFATIDGKAIQTVNARERGKGVVNVYTSELNPGIYIYTLIADGKIIDTKRMEVLR